MAAEDTKYSVVTVKRGVDKATLMDELTAVGGSEFIPERAVELRNQRNDSERSFDLYLTSQEADLLSLDPRVYAVRWGSMADNGIVEPPCAVRSHGHSSKVETGNLAADNLENWGLVASASKINPYPSNRTLEQFVNEYSLDGEGVDVVVVEPNGSHAYWDHPEWISAKTGLSRFVKLDWKVASGIADLPDLPVDFYDAVTAGHGTAVASLACGRRYGFAKEAAIYTISYGGGYSSTQAFSAIRNWHLKKVQSGNLRPTVINGSFAQVWALDKTTNYIASGSYRGAPFTGDMSTEAGLAAMLPYKVPFKYRRDVHGEGYAPYLDYWGSSLAAEAESCIDAGIVICGAAGNFITYSDVPGGLDYDNTIITSAGNTIKYCRGSWSAADEVICVGSYGPEQAGDGKDVSSYFTAKGPRIDIYGPGGSVTTADIPSSVGPTVGLYPGSSTYKASRGGGTSYSTPMVAGVVAMLMQLRPWMTPAECRAAIREFAVTGRLDESAASYESSMHYTGPGTRVLHQPFGAGNSRVG